jgi:predicted alpha/beta superfamily hydrolase
LTAGVAASDTFQETYSLPRTTVFSLPSKQSNANYRIYVSVPAAHDSTQNRFPVVYLLDGDWYFGLAVSTSRLLEHVGEQREAILVAIGYGGTIDEQRRRRTREFTPTPEPTLPGSGHAAKFLTALQQDIIPAIESRYRTTSERVLVGHSLGGLFAAYAITRAPTLFRHVVIGSPAFWTMNDTIIRDVETLLRGRSQVPARMFVGESSGDWTGIRSSFAKLVATLEANAPADLKWSSADFAKTTHQSSVAALIASGLPWVLSPKQD